MLGFHAGQSAGAPDRSSPVLATFPLAEGWPGSASECEVVGCGAL